MVPRPHCILHKYADHCGWWASAILYLSPYHANFTLAIAVTVVMCFTIQHYRSTKASDNKLVANMVHIAVEILHNKMQSHLNAPSINDKPYLSSIELQNKLVQVESKMSRRRLWNQVVKTVESNENVWMRSTSHNDSWLWRWFNDGTCEWYCDSHGGHVRI